MNAILQAMKERRSIRKYKADMVPKELIEQVMEAGLYAASGKSVQKTKIIAITNKEVRDKFSALNCKIGGWKEGFDPFYGAPVVLLVIADKSDYNYIKDGSLVMANLMLAAHALGLGSCWINRADKEIEAEEGQALLKELGIEGDWVGIGNCILGYMNCELPKVIARKPERTFFVD